VKEHGQGANERVGNTDIIKLSSDPTEYRMDRAVACEIPIGFGEGPLRIAVQPLLVRDHASPWPVVPRPSDSFLSVGVVDVAPCANSKTIDQSPFKVAKVLLPLDVGDQRMDIAAWHVAAFLVGTFLY
jgi:hypothetical protein